MCQLSVRNVSNVPVMCWWNVGQIIKFRIPVRGTCYVMLILIILCSSDLRLQLLDTQHNYYLLKALYGLLMLLPQSDAFNTLKNRLDCVPNGRALSEQIR